MGIPAYEHILLEKESRKRGVAIITLDRPEVLNAMNRKLSTELHECVMDMNADDEIGCIVITGTGERAFSAGGDIHEQRETARLSEEEQAALSGGREGWSYDISASPKPVIGMINGLAYGGAAVLSSSLDFRIGCENTRLGSWRLLTGESTARGPCPTRLAGRWPKSCCLPGEVVEAEEAYRIGLLNHLVPKEGLRDKTMEIATIIAGNRHESVQGFKRLLLEGRGADLRQQYENERYFNREVVQGYGVEQAFPEFISRRGRPVDG